MSTINFRYPGKELLKKEAEDNGFNSLTDYMIHIIENRNNGSSKPEPQKVKKLIRLEPVGKDGHVVKTRVTEDEKLALKNFCLNTRETESSVLLRQIRILLTNGADFSKDEIAALRKATTQITAIGRNLNQIVAQINSGIITDSKLSVYNIEQLKEYIDNQAKAIRALIQKTKDRVIENG